MKTRTIALVLLAGILAFGQYISSYGGTKTVTTAGTPVALSASNVIAKSVIIQALSTNTGSICIGGAAVSASSKTGTCLTAGQAIPLYFMAGFPYDLSKIYIDSTVNGEGVGYSYYAQ